MMGLEEGPKYVCTSKFIYRTKTDALQFGKCYGIPAEYAIKCKQRGISKDEMYVVASKFSEKYIREYVMYNDKFFSNIKQFMPKEPKVTAVETTEELNAVDLKEWIKNDD
jgi:hypothetical protein